MFGRAIQYSKIGGPQLIEELEPKANLFALVPIEGSFNISVD